MKRWYEKCAKNWRWWAMLPFVLMLGVVSIAIWLAGQAFSLAYAALEATEEQALHPLIRSIKNWVHLSGNKQ